MTDSLFKDSRALPVPAERARADEGLARWREAAEREEDSDITRFALALAEDSGGRALIESVAGHSPYLGKAMCDHLATSRAILSDGPARVVADAVAALAARADETLPQAMARMRRAKARAALAIGLADLAGAWNVDAVTGALSELAEAALDGAVAHLYPARRGYVVLGMGKLGGRELNYSSDIDLIVFYDAERAGIDREEAGAFFVRITRNLVRTMGERTGDGYVFRTDLNLRPDPGSTPVAISIRAAEVYYESAGQNWERAAMIKARPVAGDREAGERVIEMLRPFVWRKNLDFAAIQDIHSIKRQINAYRGGAAIALAGHNVKLGRGGIREIEFFAQTQQLIWGGRDSRLRVRPTKVALAALTKAGHITVNARDELTRAYDFLRRLEHRLQMVEDQQTHTMPADEAGLDAIGKFMGFADGSSFGAALLTELRTVEEHYAHLFEEAPALSGPGNLVFTGSEDDPETMATLARMGFADTHRVADVVRAWHRGRYRAMRSARAREILTELMPGLLEALAATADPDTALLRFDAFLQALPAGVQLFSLLLANPRLLALVAEAMGSAPRLADALSRNPALVEGLLVAQTVSADPDALAQDLAPRLAPVRALEEALDVVRRWNNDLTFQVGVQVLQGAIDPEGAGPSLAAIAETALAALYPRVETDFIARAGALDGGMSIVALGKLGGREMAFGSDLDLLSVYDGPGASVAHARLSQRFIAAVNAPTAEGKLYEVDMRLRPSGNKGPIATSLDGFVRYHADEAWTWEHMALTRGRVVAGDAAVGVRIEAEIRAVLTRPRDPEKLLADVADMRRRMERELTTPGDIWDVKHLRGGLVDIEFIAQYLQLRHAHDRPEVLDTNTGAALDKLARAGLLDAAIAGELEAALHLWRNLQGMLRLTTGGVFDEANATDGLRAAIARAAGAEKFGEVAERIRETAARVRGHFETLIDAPAAALQQGK